MSLAEPMSRVDAGTLRLDDVSVAFGATVGLRDVSLTIPAGERVALLGPSGVGKSSLLRVMAGLDDLLAGRITLGTRDITALVPRERGIVYLHQRPLLFPHLSVVDNVAFPLTVRGVPRAAARARAKELLTLVHMATMADRPSTALSGGEQHRVAVARALAARPSVLLLDEPFAALDPTLRSDVREAVIAVLQQQRLTTVLVTHDVNEALGFADRVVVMIDARVAQVEPPATLLARPASVKVARFLGIPNIVPVHRSTDGTLYSALGRIPIPATFARGWLICRAPALHLGPFVTSTSVDSPLRGRVVARLEGVEGTRWQVEIDGQRLQAINMENHVPCVGDTVPVMVRWNDVQLLADEESPMASAHV